MREKGPNTLDQSVKNHLAQNNTKVTFLIFIGSPCILSNEMFLFLYFQDPSNPYPWPMFSNFPVPSEYVPHDSNTVMTAFEQQDDIGRFLSETDSNSFDTLEDARNWLSKCRDVFVSSVRQNPAMVSLFLWISKNRHICKITKILLFCPILSSIILLVRVIRLL